MRYTEGVYKRKRNGKIVYGGVLAYYDERQTQVRAPRTQNPIRRYRSTAKATQRIRRARPKALENNVVNFAQLADYCEQEVYLEAEYSAGEKLSVDQTKPI